MVREIKRRGKYRASLVVWALLTVLALLWGARNAIAQATDSVCAEVKIVIEQQMSLERQAFNAKMVITNGLADQTLQNVSIELKFLDANNSVVTATTDPNAVGASFFYRNDVLEGIGSLTGGTIVPKTAATINWLIIPAAGTGGRLPTGAVYYVGAKVSYTLDGVSNSVDVAPESIVVRPQPELVLDYFLPTDVYGDDPFTEQDEPPVPFTLGVRVKNEGAGTSVKTKIDTAQPKIVENSLGLLINFQILNGYVGDEPLGKSLLLNFGDISPGSSKMGRWNMVTSLSGRFVEFTASFTHADSLGGAVTSLLKQVRTHTLVHDVLVDLAGRDRVRDFLAKDGDVYRVYESSGVDTEVFDQTASASAVQAGASLKLTFNAVPSAFAYARVSDPYAGSKVPVRVVREDGYVLPPENVWLSKERQPNLSWRYFINLFDADTVGRYTISFTDGDAQASIEGAVFDDRNGNGVREVDEPGIAGLDISLGGVETASGASVSLHKATNAQGLYKFENLKPGTYSLSAPVSAGLVDGAALPGTAGGNSEPGKFTSIALVAGTQATGYLFSKRTSAPEPVEPVLSADVGVNVTAMPSSPKKGESSSITVTASNAGPASASDVVAQVSVPAGLTVSSSTPTSGSYAAGKWNLGSLDKGASAALTLVVKPTADTTVKRFTISASIGASTPDEVNTNNSASRSIEWEEDEGLTGEQSLDQGLRVLAWTACETNAPAACVEERKNAAAQVLAGASAAAQIFVEAEGFKAALRAGDYSVLWLNGCVDALSSDLMEEVRAAVYRGASLMVDGSPDTHLRDLSDTWGSYADQAMPANAALQIDASTLPWPGEAWQLKPRVASDALAKYATGEAFAVKSRYGSGQILALGVDALAGHTVGESWTRWLQKQWRGLTPVVADPMLAGATVRIQTVIKNDTTATQRANLKMDLSAGVKLLSATPEPIQNTASPEWRLNLASDVEQVVQALLQLPETTAASVMQSELSTAEDSQVQGRWTQRVQTIAASQAMENTRAAIAALVNVSEAERLAWNALLEQADEQFQQGHAAQALVTLIGLHRQLREQSLNAALHPLTQWMGLVAMEAKDDVTVPDTHVLAVMQGDRQTARVGEAYALALQVRLLDAQGVPVPGAEVTFAAPASGASASFGGGVILVRATTDAQGLASTGLVIANQVTGDFKIIASVSNAAQAVSFSLSNLDAAAQVLSLQLLSGSAQQAEVSQAFASPVTVQVSNKNAGVAPGVPVTFLLPANAGASAVFVSGSRQAVITTDAQGRATSPLFRANAVAGDYVMVVSAEGASASVSVHLSNTEAPATGVQELTLATPTGSGNVTLSISGGGAGCRIDPSKTALRKPQGWLPLFDVLLFPHGVLDYELTGCDVGGTVKVTTVWPNMLGINNYLKYGPTPAAPKISLWYPPRNLKIEGRKVSYTITDGQLGDDDLKANGTIKDPGGVVIQSGPLPGQQDATPVPGLKYWAMALLTLLVMLGWVRQKRDATKARAHALSGGRHGG